MNKFLKVTLCYTMSLVLFLMIPMSVQAMPEIEAPSYILLEASTGKVICAENVI